MRRHSGLVAESLESRILLSAETFQPPIPVDGPGTPPPAPPTENEDSDDTAVPPANVAGGMYLTSLGGSDIKGMEFNDVRQGLLDTCTFASVLAAAALTNFDLGAGITVQSQAGNTTVYNVRLYIKNGAGQFTATTQSVTYDGIIQPDDLRPADAKEYWTAIYQRAYLALNTSPSR